jgi:hypothetical protein
MRAEIVETVRLRIAPLTAQEAYPIELFEFPGGSLIASDSIPRREIGEGTWSAAAIRDAFRGEGAINLALIGRQFFSWINRSGVAVEWGKKRKANCRTLLDIAAEELRDLPWELLAETASQLFRSIRKPMARYYLSDPALDDTTPQWPLRLLIVVGAKDDEKDDVQAPDEVTAIERGLLPYSHSIDVEICWRPTRAELSAAIGSFRPHLLHFIGHSRRAQSGEAVLAFQGSVPWDWGTFDVAALLDQQNWRPRLVFLNACRTAEEREMASIGAAFLQAGVPASVTMQGDIRGDLAGEFAAAVYGALWEGKQVDEAVVLGREAILAGPGGNARAWAFPVLSVAALPETILPRPVCTDPARYRHIENCDVFEQVKFFCGRRKERRQIRLKFDPLEPQGAGEHLLLVTGSKEIGKTHVIKWCAEGFALGGYDVHYVDVAESEPKEHLDVLRQILDAKPARAAEPLPRELLWKFDWDVYHLATNASRVKWDGKPFTMEKIDVNRLNTNDWVDKVFEAFHAALGQAAERRRLVIVLDQFRRGESSPVIPNELMRDWLWPRLFLPVKKGQLKNVRMVLVMRTEDCDFYGMADKILPKDWVTLAAIPPKEYPKYARELFWYADLENEDLRKLIGILKERVRDPWGGSKLLSLQKAAEVVFEGDKEYMTKVHRMR